MLSARGEKCKPRLAWVTDIRHHSNLKSRTFMITTHNVTNSGQTPCIHWLAFTGEFISFGFSMASRSVNIYSYWLYLYWVDIEHEIMHQAPFAISSGNVVFSDFNTHVRHAFPSRPAKATTTDTCMFQGLHWDNAPTPQQSLQVSTAIGSNGHWKCMSKGLCIVVNQSSSAVYNFRTSD